MRQTYSANSILTGERAHDSLQVDDFIIYIYIYILYKSSTDCRNVEIAYHLSGRVSDTDFEARPRGSTSANVQMH